MQNLLNDLEALLAKDPSLTADGKLLKNAVIERAAKLDAVLLQKLLGHAALRAHFFVEVDGVAVFDKVKFQDFVSNKAFLPDSYTAYRNRIGLTDCRGRFLKDSDEVVLAWPYKDCVLEGGQTKEDRGRDEVFWNTTLAPDDISRLFEPKVLTKLERWDSEAVNTGKPNAVGEIGRNDNLLIKGNNLLALHTLKARYAGEIDLVYIDPPYNPPSAANTFLYNNRFNHSTWLTFIKNRLEVAKQLMKRDGSLIVAIDDNEFYFLGVLLTELFPTHEVHCITLVHNPRGVQGTNFSYTHEYAFFVIPRGKRTISPRRIEAEEIDWAPLRNWGTESERLDAANCFYPVLVKDGAIVGFGKDETSNSSFHPSKNVPLPDGTIQVWPIDAKGVERKWRYARQSVEDVKHLLRPVSKKGVVDIELGKDFGLQRTVWQDTRYDANVYGTQLLKTLAPSCDFSYPKSIWTVFDCIKAVVGDNKSAVVLDFFAGSGTTGHAVLELNKVDGGSRRFILAEQLDYIERCTKARITAVMRNDHLNEQLVYAELAEWNAKLADEVRDAETPQAVAEVVARIKAGGYLRPGVELSALEESAFDALALADQKRLLLDVLDANHLYVNVGDMADETFGISLEDQAVNLAFQDRSR